MKAEQPNSETVSTTESLSLTSPVMSTLSLEHQMRSLEEITSGLPGKITSPIEEDLQTEIAAFVRMFPTLSLPANRRYLTIVQMIASALLSEPSKITLAKELRRTLERDLQRSPLGEILRGGNSPVARVLFGLGTLLYFAIPLVFLRLAHHLGDTGQFLGMDRAQLMLVALCGALGSIVSIMVRIRDFSAATEMDQTVLFFTGFFKPLIGTAFALSVYVVLNSGILPITVQKEKAAYFFAALGFVSGFSERFASDVASQTERVISSSVTTTETKRVT